MEFDFDRSLFSSYVIILFENLNTGKTLSNETK